MNRYLVKRADGTLLVVAAERHRRHDSQVLFEIRNYDRDLPAEQRWRTVASLPEGDIEQITVAPGPAGHPGTVASSSNGQDPARSRDAS